MIGTAFRTKWSGVVAATWWDDFVEAWKCIGEDLVARRWSQGWRPKDPFDLEIVTAWLREGNRGVDAPLREHAGSLDG